MSVTLDLFSIDVIPKETALWIAAVKSRASKLMVTTTEPGKPDTPREGSDSPFQNFGLKRQGARKVSRQNSTETNLAKAIHKPRGLKRGRSRVAEEPIQFHFSGELKEVGFTLMTSYVNFSSLQAANLMAVFKVLLWIRSILTRLRDHGLGISGSGSRLDLSRKMLCLILTEKDRYFFLNFF